MSIVASLFVLAWSLTAFCHLRRKETQNEDDKFVVKLIHWISRIAEIVPRILLIALIAAEYGLYVLCFIIYRFFFANIYTLCEKQGQEGSITISELPDLCLGILGNLLCFYVTDIYKCHKKHKCGGKFFAIYYILYYLENAGLLYLWYSDDPVLLTIKIGRACSNHEWFLPYVFVVVIVGFIVHLLSLKFYYKLRKTKKYTLDHERLEEESDTPPIADTQSIADTFDETYL